MESDKYIIETDVLDLLAREGMDAARKEILLRMQKVQEEILELCLTNQRESLYTSNVNDAAKDCPQIPPTTVEWLKTSWEDILSKICQAVIPQSLVTESSVLMYDRCISTLLLAVSVVTKGPIVATRVTISHLSNALLVLINRATSEGQEAPIFTLGILSEAFYGVTMRIQEAAGTPIVEDESDTTRHPLCPLERYHVHLTKLPSHSSSFITYADDSYGVLYKLVEWGDTSPALLTAVCGNIYLSLGPPNNCI
ncbi:hypothetical protein GL50803_007677 [Giardia duodenalis]|uniref:Uncharacterized protein n=2 Tax=Giardia intestinalis TaxID=5741 RepID=A8BA62_GIAIC|nr:hypothetical protein GL50803_007677 [Giardia intestinalis]ESU38669.1 Hypothetical protein DHA2_150009 [Giardia intestinalis]KAE8303569.1 hypothetical protein GL50803_007677 [Giardia intestinalis]|eukprot:XP_001708314.1 Hypothetical protein GL50803_7677 [Giardia lamblia ATCC 50803]